ncbi:MAG: hypothetical protein ACR2IF_00885 [Terriglobales bacterium]
MNISELKLKGTRRVALRLRVLIVVGAAIASAGVVAQPNRFWPNLLLVSFFLLSLSLAGAVFIAMQHVVGAHWAIAFRRVPEAMAKLLPIGGAGLLVVLFLHPSLYPWTSVGGEHVPAFRHWWLSLTFFRGRAIFFLLLWSGLIMLLLRASARQDEDGSARHTRNAARISAVFVVLFGFSFWLATYDWIMSLEPQWYSTIFASYNFAGLFVGGLAALTLLLLWLRNNSGLSAVITSDHLHDVGKLLFAFSTFWMYLWFSQYMLIWYANIPEETTYFVSRLHGYWGSLFILDMVLNWVGPFFALLPRRNKQNPAVLAKVCVVLLAGRWLDLYLMIMPQFVGMKWPIGAIEIGLLIAGSGVFVFSFLRVVRRRPLVPARDPYLQESLHYHA